MKERENNRLLLTDSQTMRGRLLESLAREGPRIFRESSKLLAYLRSYGESSTPPPKKEKGCKLKTNKTLNKQDK